MFRDPCVVPVDARVLDLVNEGELEYLGVAVYLHLCGQATLGLDQGPSVIAADLKTTPRAVIRQLKVLREHGLLLGFQPAADSTPPAPRTAPPTSAQIRKATRMARVKQGLG